MIAIPADTPYCIDATEVTVAQYHEFFRDGTKPALPLECAGKTGYDSFNSDADPKFPAEAEWCDAWSYCAWAGKHLCGKIGGGATPMGGLGLTGTSQWYRACSRDSTREYPYGPYVAGNCNDGNPSGSLGEVGSFKKCEGGYDGIFDMSGNLAEWENACTPAPDGGTHDEDLCAYRGGESTSPPGDVKCAAEATSPRSFGIYGIRCCYG
jgi:formylglycine-generating enzyme required for sulfatase activity